MTKVVHQQTGFTLLEILVALFIVAIGIAAVSKATGSTISMVQNLENRLMANWVASNQLSELRLTRNWPNVNESDSKVEYAGRIWYVKQNSTTTTDADILRVDIKVFTDTNYSESAGNMFGYLVRHAVP